MNKKVYNLITGKVITGRRLHRGLKQHELADKANINRSHLSDVEKGMVNPTLDTVHKLAKGLDTSATSIVREIEEDYNSNFKEIMDKKE
ncbi:helix-turn-helix domain-containing protein [Evansella tamaricis]|uniref:Helix-turn-helix domain-containing protein n=1 Tax=Evansella tamaricis TaxID=2069301 RepID=A0ABS6JH65_9BACI|nr:helix-turn-helix transcriptional regulator [Evansella tamaricis]MBU9711683.1 helix-turn-helix domain-containing protein [Evansella tamaricis]